jgi:hypothetical protein
LENNPKVAFQVNESNVVWYTNSCREGFSTKAALTSGSYYGAIQDLATGCESAVRLLVNVVKIQVPQKQIYDPESVWREHPKVADFR